ncbi:MAG: hypothetical protein ABIE22_03545 [archaeon]
MAKKSKGLGGWAFLIGVILAIVFALIGSLSSGLLIALVVIGLIVGLLNVTDEESTHFLLSSVALVIVAAFGSNVVSAIDVLDRVLNALLAIFVPATIVVAIRNVMSIAKH